MNNEPLVTVLTPVYNGADFLAECIESVLHQTHRNFEYIIVNNCSTDRSLEIALDYAKKDSRIRVHNNDHFVGVIENHNLAFGLISSSAKYCKVVSADDYIFRDCLSRMVEFAEANPSVGIVGSYQLCGNVIKCQGCTYPKTVFTGREICRRFLLLRQVFVEGQPILGFGSPTSILYCADLIRDSGGHFYPNPSPHSDTSACFAQLRTTFFGFVYQVLSYERSHRETQTSRSVSMNRHASAFIDDLLNYGRSYLSDDEFTRLLKTRLNNYRRYLAIEYFIGFQNKEYWDYHKARLRELGYPLTAFTLFKTALVAIAEEAVNPGQAIRKLWTRLGHA